MKAIVVSSKVEEFKENDYSKKSVEQSCKDCGNGLCVKKQALKTVEIYVKMVADIDDVLALMGADCSSFIYDLDMVDVRKVNKANKRPFSVIAEFIRSKLQ